MSKRAVVCGAGGFIGHHLVKRLKAEGYWVRGVDLKHPEFSHSAADEFLILDLREPLSCQQAVELPSGHFDEVYQLAADMGGMGFIHSAECEILFNSSLINLHMIQATAEEGIANYFFSSSACVYPDMESSDGFVDEAAAYPAQPDNEYGWEKLYAERVALAYGRKYNINIRIARFQNCYGPQGTWDGGREKAPAALCRKIAAVESGEMIEVWGDGTAMRSYTYIDDMTDGIYKLMQSDITEPTNIGSAEFVSVNELVEKILEVSGKEVHIKHIDGPVGVSARNHLFEQIETTGWKARFSLLDGIRETYAWINGQVEAKSREEDQLGRKENAQPSIPATH